MTDLPRHGDTGEDLRAERLDALARMLSPEGPPDPSELAPPTYWPSLSREEAVEEWDYLRAWVEALLARFGHLSPEVIPPCWYRHPGHVEALAALADFQRACYGHSALPVDAVRWHQAFRDIEDRLRAWTTAAGCAPSSGHKTNPPPTPIDEDRRRQRRLPARQPLTTAFGLDCPVSGPSIRSNRYNDQVRPVQYAVLSPLGSTKGRRPHPRDQDLGGPQVNRQTQRSDRDAPYR
jgi:hypothetical protein